MANIGEIWNTESGSSIKTKQLNLICLHGNKYKGEGFANNGDLAL